VSLGEMIGKEGFYAVPGSHNKAPSSFMRRIQGEGKEFKAMMQPGVRDEMHDTVQVSLRSGDVLAYSGNLLYKMYVSLEHE